MKVIFQSSVPFRFSFCLVIGVDWKDNLLQCLSAKPLQHQCGRQGAGREIVSGESAESAWLFCWKTASQMLWRSPQGKLLSLLSTAFPSFRNDSCICDVGIVLTSLATVTKDLTRRNIEEEEFILALGWKENSQSWWRKHGFRWIPSNERVGCLFISQYELTGRRMSELRWMSPVERTSYVWMDLAVVNNKWGLMS